MELPKISIKAARVNAEMTQWQAAEALGIDRRSLQNYESGISIPRWDVVHKMEEVYGIHVDYLRFGKKSALSGVRKECNDLGD